MLRRRGRDVLGVALGGAVLLATGRLAGRGVAGAEARVFRAANSLPDGAYRAVWVPMQYGTFGIAPALAAVALLLRRPRLAVALVSAGTAAWVLAKAVKPAVGRERPGSILEGVRLRGKEEGDLGFPSGHAAVSAALTIVACPYLGKGWRLPPVVLTALMPFARVYVGAHLPLDVIGGSALGIAVGCAVNLALRAPTKEDHLPDGPRLAPTVRSWVAVAGRLHPLCCGTWLSLLGQTQRTSAAKKGDALPRSTRSAAQVYADYNRHPGDRHPPFSATAEAFETKCSTP